MSDNWVGLMTRWPETGKVKTRLAKGIGVTSALALYCSLLENSYQRCRPDKVDNYRLACFVTPGDKCQVFESRFSGYAFYHPQSDGDLGRRMQAALSFLLKELRANKAILIGADIPLLGRAQLRQAFRALEHHEVVWGPTDDGGYYLVGMSMIRPCLFRNVDWGTGRVLSQSTEIARKHGLSFALLEPLHDLDTVEDLALFPFLKTDANKKR